MTNLAHPNWRELTQFVRDLNAELMTPNGKIKAKYISVNPALQEAITQFWAETSELIESADGSAQMYGYGISGMTPKQWFNDDLALRQRWASVIEAAYNRYQEAVKAEKADDNDIMKELAKLRQQVYKLTEAMNQSDNEDMEKKMGLADDERAEGEKPVEEEDEEKVKEADEEDVPMDEGDDEELDEEDEEEKDKEA